MRHVVTISWALLLLSVCALGQSSPEKGAWDIGAWGATGVSVPGGTPDVSSDALGFRLGKVLTGAHLPGFLRGNFEYAIDLVPLYYIFQEVRPRSCPSCSATPSNTYGGGFNPINLKWNFNAPSVTPYVELGGGTLFSTHDVPAGTNTVNFRTHASFGIHLLRDHGPAPTIEVRYEHISNAGLATPNPGINTVQFVVGVNWFRRHL